MCEYVLDWPSVYGKGAGRCRSPHHSMPCKSINEGSTCEGLDDMAGIGLCRYRFPRHGMPFSEKNVSPICVLMA